MKKTFLLCSLALLALPAVSAEFYRLDLSGLAPGTVLVKTVGDKPLPLRPTWGMWPRTADSIGAAVVERDGVKAVEVRKGFQINTSEWDVKNSDAQQSVIYCRFRFLVPSAEGKGIVGSLRLQQINNRTAAFIGFEPKNGKIEVIAGNGRGDGGINWNRVASVEAGKWFTLDIKLDFNEKKYDVAVDGGTPLKERNFRHAAQWAGTMWAQELGKKEYRYDVEASAASDLLFTDAAFSDEPFPAEAK